MPRSLPVFKTFALREDGFREGHSLCPGCMEATTFHTLGRATDNGRKTVLALGTFCGEVSTLAWPDRVAWGRGAASPLAVEKSMGIIHNVFESAPTVAEAVRDSADLFEQLGAWRGSSPNVLSVSGDGGALSIGLRTFLHTIHRQARIVLVVCINEVFANTGFQYSPTAIPWADSATTPGGQPLWPLDHVGLAIDAGAGFVGQGSPAFAPFFAELVEEALACTTTAVLFVPAPCISGWKFEEGLAAELGRLASQTGLFPCLRKRAGAAGELKHVPDAPRRPRVEEFLARQERFRHVVRLEAGQPVVVAGREKEVAEIQAFADRNVERLQARLALA
jgi:pyruvate ferredoxin oxidoreductase beta subunit